MTLARSENIFAKNKIVLGFLVVAMTAILGTAGIVGATPDPAKEACKNGGWQALGYKNQGQCIKDFNKGYGGGHNTNVSVVVNGNNNIVQVIINIIMGRR